MKTQISRWLTIALITMLNPSWGNATALDSSHHLVLAEETQTTLSVRDAQGTLLTTLANGIVDKNVQLATANGDDLPKSVLLFIMMSRFRDILLKDRQYFLCPSLSQVGLFKGDFLRNLHCCLPRTLIQGNCCTKYPMITSCYLRLLSLNLHGNHR